MLLFPFLPQLQLHLAEFNGLPVILFGVDLHRMPTDFIEAYFTEGLIDIIAVAAGRKDCNRFLLKLLQIGPGAKINTG